MDHDAPPMGAYTNIWGVGAVIFELLTLKQAAHYLYTTPATQKNGKEALPAEICRKIAHNRYSADLINLVAQCLRPNPLDRPTVGDLVEATMEGRIENFGDLQAWHEDGDGDDDARLEPYRIPWDDLDAMESRDDEWAPSVGQRYEDPNLLTVLRAGVSTPVAVKEEEKKSKTPPRRTAPHLTPPPPPQGQGQGGEIYQSISPATVASEDQHDPSPDDDDAPRDPSPDDDDDDGDDDEEEGWDDWDEEDMGEGRPFLPGQRGELDGLESGQEEEGEGEEV